METISIAKRTALQNANTIVRNGVVSPKYGYRAMVFDGKSGKPRRVYKQVFHGKTSERGTWQICLEGDIVIKAYHDKGNPNKDIAIQPYLFLSGNMSGVEMGDKRLDVLDGDYLSKHMDWLSDLGARGESKSSFVPAGFGWDGEKSYYETHKEGRIRNLIWCIKAPEREPLVDAAAKTTWKLLDLAWKEAKAFPAMLSGAVDELDGQHEDTRVEWVLYNDDGSNEHVKFDTQTKSWYSSLEDSKINNTKGEAVHFPKHTARAVKLIIDFDLAENGDKRGVSIILYSRVSDDSTIGMRPSRKKKGAKFE